jgi:hypothetical protein
MPGLEEDETVWRYCVQASEKFDRTHVRVLSNKTGDAKITLGRIRGTNRWEVQNYLFAKQRFKTREQVQEWLDEHLKSQIQMLVDFRAWNEYIRRNVNAYMRISKVEG